jgi:hypothetical protein
MHVPVTVTVYIENLWDCESNSARNMHEHKKGGNFLTMVTNNVQSPMNGIVSQSFIGLTVSLHHRE